MDPQQRKMLEIVYECLENAGVPLEDVKGSNAGVFAGSFTLDYWMMQTRESDYLSRYHATGIGTTILSNRISHALDLVGPRFALSRRYTKHLGRTDAIIALPLTQDAHHLCTLCTKRFRPWMQKNVTLLLSARRISYSRLNSSWEP